MSAAPNEGSAECRLIDDQVILCILAGNVTGRVVAGSMRQTEELVDEIRSKHLRPRLLLDVRKVTHQTSEARSRAKGLGSLGLERVAVIGRNSAIMMVGRYIARSAGMNEYTRFFRSEYKAKEWLRRASVKYQDTKETTRRIAVALVVLIALATLTGWATDTAVLKSFIPAFKAMNPLSAITFLILAAGLLMAPRAHGKTFNKIIAVFAGVWSLALGLHILASYFVGSDSSVDEILFQSEIGSGRFAGHIAPSSALGFVGAGSMLLLLVLRLKSSIRLYSFHLLGFVLATAALTSMVGYSFGFDHYTYFDHFISMPLNTALTFLVLLFALLVSAPPVSFSAWVLRAYGSYWQAICIFVLLVLTTGIVWQQTKNDLSASVDRTSLEDFTQTESRIASRFAAYTDALNGYRGLFAASSDVTATEFRDYFASSGLTANYPGFRAIAYVPAVPAAEKEAFIKRVKEYATVEYPQYSSFKPYPETTQALYYPVLFSQPATATTQYGFDLASETVRRETLESVRDSGRVKATEVIDLNASRSGEPVSEGFFIALPLYRQHTSGRQPSTAVERRENLRGFFLAYFRNEDLFRDIFKGVNHDTASFVITEVASDRQLYISKSFETNTERPRQSTTITIGDRAWRLDMYTGSNYAASSTYTWLPGAILAGGLALSVLTGLVVLGQLRRRDQALQLADAMTKDLNNERQLAVANQQKDEAILSSIGDAVFAIDTKERITLFNPAAETISGYSAAEAVGRPYRDTLRFSFEGSGKINDTFIRQALRGHVTTMKNHTVLTRKDGRFVAVADSAAPIYDARRELLGVIVVFRDVSKEQELDRAKDEFVSLASHQLRTPLSAINWYSEMLLGEDAGKLNRDQRSYVQEIFDGNARMVELVNSLLDVSRLDLGKLSNRPEPTNMSELADSLEKELATAITSKQLNYTVQMQKDLPLVLADPKLLRMIVQNLLSNAVKYTPEKGAVTVVMREAARAEVMNATLNHEHRYLFMSVKDTGYGIPKQQQSKIFGKLFRADNVQSLDVEGTGLGLYIVRQVINKLGGRVWFESTESVGSTFFVLLPVKTKTFKLDGK